MVGRGGGGAKTSDESLVIEVEAKLEKFKLSSPFLLVSIYAHLPYSFS